jgi:hypothetical protein
MQTFTSQGRLQELKKESPPANRSCNFIIAGKPDRHRYSVGPGLAERFIWSHDCPPLKLANGVPP